MAESGDAYGAIEKCGLVIRKLKRQKKDNEAFLNTMGLASLFIDLGYYEPSGVAAMKSFTALPNSESLTEEQKEAILAYFWKMTPECASSDLFSFTEKVIALTGDADHSKRSKQAEIANLANKYHQAQVSYLRLILEKCDDNLPVTSEINTLYDLLNRWINTIDDADVKAFTAQFILIRPILALIQKNNDKSPKRIEAAHALFAKISAGCSAPLILFGKLVIRAVEQKNETAFKEVTEAYLPLTQKDKEIGHWIKAIRRSWFASGQQLNFGNLMQNIMGMLGGAQ